MEDGQISTITINKDKYISKYIKSQSTLAKIDKYQKSQKELMLLLTGSKTPASTNR